MFFESVFSGWHETTVEIEYENSAGQCSLRGIVMDRRFTLSLDMKL